MTNHELIIKSGYEIEYEERVAILSECMPEEVAKKRAEIEVMERYGI